MDFDPSDYEPSISDKLRNISPVPTACPFLLECQGHKYETDKVCEGETGITREYLGRHRYANWMAANFALPISKCPLNNGSCRIPKKYLEEISIEYRAEECDPYNFDYLQCEAFSLWFWTLKASGKDISGMWDDKKQQRVERKEKPKQVQV